MLNVPFAAPAMNLIFGHIEQHPSFSLIKRLGCCISYCGATPITKKGNPNQGALEGAPLHSLLGKLVCMVAETFSTCRYLPVETMTKVTSRPELIAFAG
jgi:hypothetical protein